MKRSYRQECGLAHALDRVGERWTLLIVRELMIGPRRYGELTEALAGIGTNLLAARLKELEQTRLIEKTGQRYRLTEMGQQLEPAVNALIRFGLNLGVEPDQERLVRPEWDVVALGALFRESHSDLLRGSFELRLDGHPFAIEWSDSTPKVSEGAAQDPEVVVSLDKSTAFALSRGEAGWSEAIETGAVSIRGSRRSAKQLLQAFSILPIGSRNLLSASS